MNHGISGSCPRDEVQRIKAVLLQWEERYRKIYDATAKSQGEMALESRLYFCISLVMEEWGRRGGGRGRGGGGGRGLPVSTFHLHCCSLDE